VQGALVAALAAAGGSYRESWRTAPIAYGVPFDVRAMLSLLDAPGLLTSVHRGTIEPSTDRSFWGLARTVSDELMRKGPWQHDLMVTNYGNAPLRTTFGPLTPLNALSSGSASGRVDTQKVSAITVDGRMMLTRVSPEPFPSLLAETRAVLARTCALRVGSA
jgi:hypothetical protein